MLEMPESLAMGDPPLRDGVIFHSPEPFANVGTKPWFANGSAGGMIGVGSAGLVTTSSPGGRGGRADRNLSCGPSKNETGKR